MTQTLLQYWYLVRGHRPIGFWLLLWPVLWALWIAGQGHPNPEVFCVFVAGTWLMRSAGCAINDYADRGFDGHVQRTKDRPLAAGRISGTEALFVFAGLALVALALASGWTDGCGVSAKGSHHRGPVVAGVGRVLDREG